MKTWNLRTYSFALVILAMSAASALAAPHQAFGPIAFGMSSAQADRANQRLRDSMTKAHEPVITAATARKHFVINGTKYPAKLGAKDAGVRLHLSWKADPMVKEVELVSSKYGTNNYAEAREETWDVLKDVAESKFGKAKEDRAFPALSSLQGTPKFVVTNTWEFENIRVELGVRSLRAGTAQMPLYEVVLRAVAMPPAK